MSRRVTKAQAVAAIFAAIILIPLLVVKSFFDAFGPIFTILLIVATAYLIYRYRKEKREKKLAHLRQKYSDEEIVQNIMNHKFWRGQTAEQLTDSIGQPSDIDEQLLKTKRREVWKYYSDGVNRYRLRITLENNFVTEWKQR